MIVLERILTEILRPQGMIKRKLPVEGNEVIVRKSKGGRGKADYRAEFNKTCLIPYESRFLFFKRLKQKLLLVDGASKCISVTYDAKEAKVDVPVWSRATAEKVFEAGVVKNSGNITGKIQIPGLFYILLMIPTIMSVIILGVMTGRIKI